MNVYESFRSNQELWQPIKDDCVTFVFFDKLKSILGVYARLKRIVMFLTW